MKPEQIHTRVKSSRDYSPFFYGIEGSVKVGPTYRGLNNGDLTFPKRLINKDNCMHRTFNRPCSVGEMADCINPHQFRGYKIMSGFRREEQPVTFTIGLFGHYDSDAHYLPLWSPVSFEPGK